MRKKILYISAFLIFALLLSGCTGGKPTVPDVPEPTDEDLIIDVIEKFFSALSEQRWFLAGSYCVDGSPATGFIGYFFKNVNELKDTECNAVTQKFSPDISKVDIDGDEAKAYYFMTIVTKCDDVELPYPHSGDSDGVTTLQKSGERWKIVEMGFLPI